MIVEAIIFWLIGGFVALLGNENVRNYQEIAEKDAKSSVSHMNQP